MKNFYLYVLENTVGSLDRHSLNRLLLDLSSVNSKLYYYKNIVGTLVSGGAELVENETKVLLAGQCKDFFCESGVYFVPEQLNGHSDDEIVTSRFFDSNNLEYYISDETGMFMQTQSFRISDLWLAETSGNQKIIPSRINCVKSYFERYRKEHSMLGMAIQHIYEHIGSPSQRALWEDWQRLWPDHFRAQFQKNFFSHEPLKSIVYAEGTGKGRVVALKLKK